MNKGKQFEQDFQLQLSSFLLTNLTPILLLPQRENQCLFAIVTL